MPGLSDAVWNSRKNVAKQLLCNWQGVHVLSKSQLKAFNRAASNNGFDETPSQTVQWIIDDNSALFRQGSVPDHGWW
jgi:hypothetical protein